MLSEGANIEEKIGFSLLTIFNASKNHEGVYRCIGVNGVDNVIGTPEKDDSKVTVQGMTIIFFFEL